MGLGFRVWGLGFGAYRVRVRSCSLYCEKGLVLKDKGSMNLVTFVAQEWPLTTAVQSEK